MTSRGFERGQGLIRSLYWSFQDSLLEERVSSEPVSEMGFRIRGDSEGFIGGYGSVKRVFWALISGNFVLVLQLPLLRSYPKTLNRLWFFPLAVLRW